MATWVKYLIPSVIFLIIGIFATLHFRGSQQTTTVLYDTTVVTRYNTEVQRDTVVKWFQKVVYKEVKPKTIYVQNVDSNFVENAKEQDVMLRVEKENDQLKITALNPNGKTLKEYLYEDIGRDFIATSQKGNLFVKAKKFYWNGLNAQVSYEIPVQKGMDFKTGNYYLGLSTGINYLDRADLNLLSKWDYQTKDLFVGVSINYKILK